MFAGRGRFRRRKPRVQWMPNPGTATNNPASGDVFDHWAGVAFNFVIPHTLQPTQVLEAPLVVDNPVSETFEGATLGVYQNTALNQSNEFGWRLRRVVGDIVFAYGIAELAGQAIPPPGVRIEAGIIVRRVDGQTGDPLAGTEDQDVGTLANNKDPWVWRRNWVLGWGAKGDPRVDFTWGNNIDSAFARFPSTNVEYGSKDTGARVDQKTNRKVGPEERLFLNVSVQNVPFVAGTVTDWNVDAILVMLFDYRILGSTFTVGGNRRNATR